MKKSAEKKIIAITGYTGSGKTVAANFLREKGFMVIDVDEFVHSIYAPGCALYNALLKRYKKGILAKDLQIDRKRLGDIVFGSRPAYRDFIKLVYPAMNKALLKHINCLDEKLVILDMAVLFESGFYRKADEIIYIKTDINIWNKRVALFKRKKYKMIKSYQISFPEPKKIAYSRYIIYNNKTKKDLCLKVLKAVNKISEGFNG